MELKTIAAILADPAHRSSADCLIGALKTLLEQKPYASIKVSELCAQANLSRKTFYKYFNSKDAMLSYLMESLLLDFCATDDHSGLTFSFQFWYQQRDWVRLFIQNDLWDYLFLQNWRHFMPLLRRRNWGDYFMQNPQAKELMFMFILGGINRLLHWWYLNDFKKSPEEMAQLVEYTLSGALTNIKILD